MQDGAPPPLAGVLETALYVDDMDRACAFYEGVLGLSPMFRDARLTAYPVGGRSALLLFRRGAATTTVHLPGGHLPGGHLPGRHLPTGTIPPHDGAGPIHCALAVATADLPAWQARLAAHGVAEEGRTEWPPRRGGTGSVSLYFRDPDGHLLEFATPGLWEVY